MCEQSVILMFPLTFHPSDVDLNRELESNFLEFHQPYCCWYLRGFECGRSPQKVVLETKLSVACEGTACDFYVLSLCHYLLTAISLDSEFLNPNPLGFM